MAGSGGDSRANAAMFGRPHPITFRCNLREVDPWILNYGSDLHSCLHCCGLSRELVILQASVGNSQTQLPRESHHITLGKWLSVVFLNKFIEKKSGWADSSVHVSRSP